MAVTSANERDEPPRKFRGVVLFLDQRIFDRVTTAGCGRVVVSSRQDLFHRKACRGHELPPLFVVRRMQRDREPDLQTLRRQPPHHRDQTDGTDGDAAGAESEPVRTGQDRDRLHQHSVVGERLAHAHKDDVGNVTPFFAQPAGEMQHLPSDLTRAQIAQEALLAGSAERAAHGAAGLGRDANSLATPARVGRVILHQHRLDRVTVVEPQKQLARAAVGRSLLSDGRKVRHR